MHCYRRVQHNMIEYNIVEKGIGGIIMIDEQTKRSVETMVLWGIAKEELKVYFPNIDENVLHSIYDEVKNRPDDSGDDELNNPGNISCCG